MLSRSYFVLLCAAALAAVAPRAEAASLPTSAAGLTVSVDPAHGAYVVTSQTPAWKFAGTIGAPLTGVKIAPGRDKIGAYKEISFQWAAGRLLAGTIREYDSRPLVGFAVTTPLASDTPPPDFPRFQTFPQKLHTMSFREAAHSPASFKLEQTGTPWVLFDAQYHTAILSPASDFIDSEMHGDGVSTFASGLNSPLTGLPAGFTHRSLLAVGTGVSATAHAWGSALCDLGGKPPIASSAASSSDPLVKYLGCWTDNGAYYYYNYDRTLGYTGTLLALRDAYQKEKLPVRYMQLDSWWYQKSRVGLGAAAFANGKAMKANLPDQNWNAFGGTLDYSASPDLFPAGLAAFQKQIDLPLIVHARWIDPDSPYHKDYKISGVSPIDPRWWNERMQYLKASGVAVYEQDWLSVMYPNTPEMGHVYGVGTGFGTNMADSAAKDGLAMQYCMAPPRFFLQGSQYPNLTTIRASEDRFERGKWDRFLYTSLLADSLRVRPFTDVFMSTEPGNLTLAALSAGPVGFGDALGKESRADLMRTARADGVLVKPDAPLVPTDATILADSAGQHLPLIASTYTQAGGPGAARTTYVFAYTRRGDSPDVSFTPASLGLAGSVYVCEVGKPGKVMNAGQAFTETLKYPMWAEYMAAPLGRSGIAFLGDTGQIVGTGQQRIPSLMDAPSGLTAQVAFAPGEDSVLLRGYCAKRPTVAVTSGSALPLFYDAATGIFSVVVSPAAPPRRLKAGGMDPVSLVTVRLTK